jgi:pimeloyl-ACP methyl ester carboxylesterase
MMKPQTLYRTPEGEKVVMEMYDKALTRWPVPYTGLTLATRYGPTFVIASGDPAAPPLVLLHGASSNATAWLGDVSTYSRQRRVYMVDVIGEPGKSAPSRPPLDGPAYADWLADVLDGLHLPETALGGISQGGWTAIKFASTFPQRVRRLVLLAPGGVAPARLSFVVRAIPLSLLGRWGAEANTRIVFGGQPIHPEALKFMNALLTHFRSRLDPEPIFTDEALQRLTMPVLLIAGDQDALLPSAQTAARLKQWVPNLTVQLLPGMGHVLHATAERVLPFLAAEQAVVEPVGR